MDIFIDSLSKLAYLALSKEEQSSFKQDLLQITHFFDQLTALDTTDVMPLFHPLAVTQRLREDEVTEENHVVQLEAIAPNFQDNLYCVPKVIEEG